MGIYPAAVVVGLVSAAVCLGAGVASADPPGNTPNDPANGRRMCELIAQDPTPGGVKAALNVLGESDLDVDDKVDALAYGVLYVCPEYRGLVDTVLSD